MTKKTLIKLGLGVVLFLIVPYLIGRITTFVLDRTIPRAPAPVSRPIRAEAESAMQSLARARAITRIALILIGIYYVILITVLIILWRRRANLLRA